MIILQQDFISDDKKSGITIDINHCIISKGYFDKNDKLHDEAGIKIDYSNSFVSIRHGQFKHGKEIGQIFEYVFEKQLWDKFLYESIPVEATRYIHIFDNGTWQATINRKKVNLQIKNTLFDKDRILVYFDYIEI